MSLSSRQLIALAGVFQAASLAKTLANTGQCDTKALEFSILSVLAIDPERFEDIFADKQSVMCGLNAICKQMNTPSKQHRPNNHTSKRQNMDVMRYATGLLNLEKKYAKKIQLQQQLTDGLDALIVHKDTLGLAEPAMLSRLGQLYLDTISTIRPALMVTGNPLYLRQEHVVSSVRAILLCGIRAANLWRSEGGTIWKLLFSWKHIVRQSEQLIAEQ